MNDLNAIYKCPICGRILEVVHAGEGAQKCCETEMVRMVENSIDAAIEKHVPVIERDEMGITVKVGSVEHPMIAEHYIEWIEIIFDNRVGRVYLAPGDQPEARFNITNENVEARAYCNIHGLWKSE